MFRTAEIQHYALELFEFCGNVETVQQAHFNILACDNSIQLILLFKFVSEIFKVENMDLKNLNVNR